ncbi:MAG TPA: hypothetical protein VMI54_19370 [Polyangiaceae bacterium]|nr:hypothetical protein [Polyangiaceae bacterium]
MSVVPLGGLLGAGPGGQEEPGRARFVRFADLRSLMAEAEALGLLPVEVEPLGPADRGKLALVLEEAVEGALERRGACPPGVGAATDLDTSLGDQLYRARLVEARGLCVYVPCLEGAATLGGALDAEDSAALRFWVQAPANLPVRLLLDERNRSLGVYGPPRPLAAFVDASGALELREPAPLVAPALAASAETMELSEPPPVRVAAEPKPEPSEPSLAGDVAQALVAELGAGATLVPPAPGPEDALVPPHPTPLAPPVFAEEPPTTDDVLAELLRASVTPHDEVSAVRSVAARLDDTAPDGVPIPHREHVDATPATTDGADTANGRAETNATADAEHASDDAVRALDATHALHAAEDAHLTAPPPSVSVAHGPLHPAAANDWQNWVRDLEHARGPKPLAVVERMFAMSYVPLRDAYLRGIAPREVGPILEGWATSFAKSYRDAFDALRVRGKRPTMVLDVPDAALRIGRLHGARSVQLLLVDGLRFDLGLRVELGLRARLGREVALTERLLLWSALPSDTTTQLELIGRGAEGLRDLAGPPESEVPVARGRMARTPRRIKAGHRELLKLDLVEARLSEPGAPESPRLDALGAEVTDAVAELCEKLPPRTLLFVFGDHGFCLEPQGEGTGALKHGGARPEEVLVPAFAWLVGGLQ